GGPRAAARTGLLRPPRAPADPRSGAQGGPRFGHPRGGGGRLRGGRRDAKHSPCAGFGAAAALAARGGAARSTDGGGLPWRDHDGPRRRAARSEEHTSELQSRRDIVCRLLLEKKKLLRSLPHTFILAFITEFNAHY